jgi:hypothetical protein
MTQFSQASIDKRPKDYNFMVLQFCACSVSGRILEINGTSVMSLMLESDL